jgi:hypothetical protein
MSDTLDLRRAWLDEEEGGGADDAPPSPIDEVIWPDASAPTIGNDPPGTSLSYCGDCPTVFSTTPCCG